MSVMIRATALTKVFHTTVRQPGLVGALRSLLAPQQVARTAVQDVSFTVRRGELLALLGPNGAGKSTTIKMLTGILRPTSGHAEVAGLVPYRERQRNARNIGAVFGQRTQLWWDLPARESFGILRDIYDVGEQDYQARLSEFDDLLGLSEYWDTRVRHLSLGQRVRCDLAASLIHGPAVVFLDEPTIGMDAVAKEQVRLFLDHHVQHRGLTVLLTTHDMTEVAQLARRVVLINHGSIVLDDSLADIRRRFGDTSWQVEATLATSPAPTGPGVSPPPGVRVVRVDGPRVVFGPTEDRPAALHDAVKFIVDNYQITDLGIRESDLEAVMRSAYSSLVATPSAKSAWER
jgi:ABC-2 type transport system ATP-binding protein